MACLKYRSLGRETFPLTRKEFSKEKWKGFVVLDWTISYGIYPKIVLLHRARYKIKKKDVFGKGCVHCYTLLSFWWFRLLA